MARQDPGPGSLEGKVVAVTHPSHRVGRIPDALREAGADVVLIPAIAILPPEDSRPLDEALLRLAAGGHFDWVVFASISAVEKVSARLEELGLGCAALSRVKVAAVGRSTADALQRFGISVARVPDYEDAAGLLDAFSDEDLSSVSLLMPRAAGGLDTFPEGARARGARVSEVTAYRTEATPEKVAPLLFGLRSGRIDALVLTSPSQARSVAAGLRDETSLLSRCAVACIGKTTAAAAADLGMPGRPAKRPDPEAVVELLASLLQERL